jgi:hypothetical protein
MKIALQNVRFRRTVPKYLISLARRFKPMQRRSMR